MDNIFNTMNNNPSIISDFYTALANYESFINHLEDAPFHLEGRGFLKHIPKGNIRLLDVGCGVGNLTAGLPEFVEVVGIDLAFGMLERAKEARPAGRYFEHDFHFPLPEQEGKFDIIFAIGAFDLCNDLNTTISALATSLKDDGLFYFTIAEFRLGTGDNGERERSARPSRPEQIWLHFFSFEEVCSVLESVGLVPVSYRYGNAYTSRTLEKNFDYGYWTVAKLANK